MADEKYIAVSELKKVVLRADTTDDEKLIWLRRINAIPKSNVLESVRSWWEDEKWYPLPFACHIPWTCFAKCAHCKTEQPVIIRRGEKEWEISSRFCSACGAIMEADSSGRKD